VSFRNSQQHQGKEYTTAKDNVLKFKAPEARETRKDALSELVGQGKLSELALKNS